MTNMPNNELKGRLALITGASGGIGAACALQLAAEGCDLALTYSSSKEAVDAIAEKIKAEAPSRNFESQRVSIHKADMGVPDEVVKVCQAVRAEHGRGVEVLVANAGYGKRIRDVSEIPLEEFEHTLNVNLRAPFLCVKGVVDDMKAARWGRIIFMSSIAAYGGGANGCHYAASKGGMTAMSRNLSTTLAPWNISVNDVAPAMIGNTGEYIPTKLDTYLSSVSNRACISGMFPNPDTLPGLVDSIPLKRLGEPDEVANAVTMLAKTGWMTGQSLLMTGGLK